MHLHALQRLVQLSSAPLGRSTCPLGSAGALNMPARPRSAAGALEMGGACDADNRRTASTTFRAAISRTHLPAVGSNYVLVLNILLLRSLRERTFLILCGSRAGSRSHFELSATAGGRAAISRHLRLMARNEQRIRVPSEDEADSSGQLRAPQRSRAGLSGRFRAPWSCRAGSSLFSSEVQPKAGWA